MGNQVSRKVKTAGSKAASVKSSGSTQDSNGQSNFGYSVYPINTHEANRQQTLHYLLKHVFQTSFFAPVEEQLKKADSRAVDIGCGLYAPWVADIAHEFPNCKVQGLDNVDIGSYHMPDNVDFVKADIFEGLPFPDNSIDFVHQRMMKAIFPTSELSSTFSELYRIIKPGGWLEVVEPEVLPRRGGPLITKLFTCVRGLLEQNLGSPLVGDDVKQLKDAGFVKVQTDYGSIPICWGGYMGKMFYDDLVTILMNVGPLLYENLGFQDAYNQEKYENYVDRAFDECVEYQTYFDIHWIIGQKPADRSS